MVKNPPDNAGDTEILAPSLSQEDPLEEGLTTHSSLLAWKIPMDREVPGGLVCIGYQRVGHY